LGDVAGHVSKLGWFAKIFVPSVFENKIIIKENKAKGVLIYHG